jgi:hypothetical protein
MRENDLEAMPDAEIEQTISVTLASEKLLKSLPRSAEHRDPVVRDSMRQTFAKVLVARLRLSGVRFFRSKPADWHKTHK